MAVPAFVRPKSDKRQIVLAVGLGAALCFFSGLCSVKNERFAVYALGYGRILFVGADHDAVKGAEITSAGVVCALGNGTCDRMIGLLLFHFQRPSLPLI